MVDGPSVRPASGGNETRAALPSFPPLRPARQRCNCATALPKRARARSAIWADHLAGLIFRPEAWIAPKPFGTADRSSALTPNERRRQRFSEPASGPSPKGLVMSQIDLQRSNADRHFKTQPSTTAASTFERVAAAAAANRAKAEALRKARLEQSAGEPQASPAPSPRRRAR